MLLQGNVADFLHRMYEFSPSPTARSNNTKASELDNDLRWDMILIVLI